MCFDLAARHSPRIGGDDLVVEAVEAGPPLADKPWLELACAVARDVDLQLPALAPDPFGRFPIAGVAGVVVRRVMLLITEVASQFALQRTLNQRFRQLLQKP